MGLESVPLVDIRGRLPRKGWSIGTRGANPTSVTLHYNGPPVANRTRAGELQQLGGDANWQMRAGWAGVRSGADGLQYHFAVLSDGTICQCRDIGAILWHCGHARGNRWSVSVHLPLGGNQDATDAQWLATVRLFDALLDEYGMGGRENVVGHMEWSATACPGTNLMNRLHLYRAGNPPQDVSEGTRRERVPQLFQVVFDEINIRQGPGLGYTIVDVMQPGAIFQATTIVSGQDIAGENRWAHRADHMGFGHMSLLRPLGAPVLGGGTAHDDVALPPVEAQTFAPEATRYRVIVDDTPLYAVPAIEELLLSTLSAGQELTGTVVPGAMVSHSSYWLQPTGIEGYVSISLLEPLD